MKKLILAAGALALALGAISPASAAVGSIAGHVAPAVERSADQVTKATYGYYRIPLQKVLWKLKAKGYHNFYNIKWLPKAYVIHAKDWRGYKFRIVVNAYNGYIIDVDRIGGYKFYNFYKKGYGWY